MGDLQFVCANCRCYFWLTSEEQVICAHNRLALPTLCRRCRTAQRAVPQLAGGTEMSVSNRQITSIVSAAAAAALVLSVSIAAISYSNGFASTGAAEAGTRVTTSRLHLRTGPGTSSQSLGILNRGAELNLLDRIGDWLQVTYRGQGGFVHGAYVALPPTAAVTTLGNHLNLFPPHRRILEEAGWLEYVENNIDIVEYYDWPGFQTQHGPAVGLANYDNSKRIARIAIQNRDERSVTATIVHEAAHLAGITEIGTYHNQAVAEAAAAQFLRDLNRARADTPVNNSRTMEDEARESWRLWRDRQNQEHEVGLDR